MSGGMARRSGWAARGSTYRTDPGWKLIPTASAPAAAAAATSVGRVTPQILTRRGCIGGFRGGLGVLGQEKEVLHRAAETGQGVGPVDLLARGQRGRRQTRPKDAHRPVLRVDQPDDPDPVVQVIVDLAQDAV